MAQRKKTDAARSRKVKAAVRRGATILQSDRPRRIDVHVAPPRLANVATRAQEAALKRRAR
jgi:hypothetical protein